MSSICGLEFDYNKKNITGIYEISDGGGSTLINGVINCKSLYVGGVAIVPGGTGTPGPAGPSGTITVGTTTTLSSGTPAYVTNTGSSTSAIFNFGIPQGIQGNTGQTGPQGATEPQGATGATGPQGQTGASGQDYTNALMVSLATTAGATAGGIAGSTAGASAGATAGASAGSASIATALIPINAEITAINGEIAQLTIDVDLLTSRMTTAEQTATADATAFQNQINTINARLTAIETELTVINPINGFFNQF